MDDLTRDSLPTQQDSPPSQDTPTDPYADYADLFTRIRAHCARRHWYASDSLRHIRGHFFGDEEDYQRVQQTFRYPPATEAQLQETERRLGFALPPALRGLFLQVANGGLGPAYGIVGAVGGCPTDIPVGPPWPPSLAETRTSAAWRLSDQAAEALAGHRHWRLECPNGEVPDRFFQLADWGCGIFSEVDGWTGRVYVTYATTHTGPQPDTRPDDAAGIPDLVACFEFQAHSVEDWLEAWLRDELDQGYGSWPELLGPGMPPCPEPASSTLPPRNGWAWYQEPIPQPPGNWTDGAVAQE